MEYENNAEWQPVSLEVSDLEYRCFVKRFVNSPIIIGVVAFKGQHRSDQDSLFIRWKVDEFIQMRLPKAISGLIVDFREVKNFKETKYMLPDGYLASRNKIPTRAIIPSQEIDADSYRAFEDNLSGLVLCGDQPCVEFEVALVDLIAAINRELDETEAPYPGTQLVRNPAMDIITRFREKYHQGHSEKDRNYERYWKIAPLTWLQFPPSIITTFHILDHPAFLKHPNLYFSVWSTGDKVYEATPEQIKHFFDTRQSWQQEDFYIFNDEMMWCIGVTHDDVFILTGDINKFLKK